MNEYIPEENLNCTKCGKWDHYCKCDDIELPKGKPGDKFTIVNNLNKPIVISTSDNEIMESNESVYHKSVGLIKNQVPKPHQCEVHPSVYGGKTVRCLVCGAEWKQTKGRLVGRDDNVIL